ncbi:MAG: glycosyltransferase family 2 protein [Acidobacteriota bacterium]
MTNETTASPRTSIVVCTHNRSTLLAEALDAIRAVEEPPGGVEIVVVDNRSSDDTRQVADEVAHRDDRIRVVTENELGLSAARNRGIAECVGDFVIFVDDDAFPAPTWLVSLVAVLAEDNVFAAGGGIIPRFTSDPPAWLDERFLPYLSAWDLGDEPLDLKYNEYPRGANIGFRRAAFERWGGFDIRLGRRGSSLRSCEEIEVCLRIERGGGRIRYVPNATVEHLTDGSRISDQWLSDRFGAQGRSEAIVDWMHAGFKGLRRGLTRMKRYAGTTSGHELLDRCQKRAYQAYRLRAALCPLTIPRRPRDPSQAPWLPFA